MENITLVIVELYVVLSTQIVVDSFIVNIIYTKIVGKNIVRVIAIVCTYLLGNKYLS